MNEIRDNFDITSGNHAKDHEQIMLLFVYTSTRKSFLRWNITALSQSNCRNFLCRSIIRNWNTVECQLTAHPLSSGKWSQSEVRDNFDITSGSYAKDHVQIMLLLVYTSTRKSFLRWSITALSQSNCRNFSCRSIIRNWNTVECRFQNM